MAEPAQAAQGPQVVPEVQAQVESHEELPLEAAGGGAVRAQQAALGNETASHLGMAIQMKIIQANQASVDERMAMAKQATQTVLDQFTQLHGSDALHAVPDVQKQISDINQNIAATVPNTDVGRAYSEGWAGISDDAHKTIQGHIDTETATYAKTSNSQLVAACQQQAVKAIGTPFEDQIITAQRNDMMDSIRAYGHTLNGVAFTGQGNPIIGKDGRPVPAPATQAEMDKQGVIFTQNVAQALLDKSGGKAALSYLDTDQAKDDLKAKNPELYDSLYTTAEKRLVLDQAGNVWAPTMYQKHGPENEDQAIADTLKEIPENAKDDRREVSVAAVKQLYAAKTGALMDAGWTYMMGHQGEMMPGMPDKFADRLMGSYKTWQSHAAVGKDDPETVFALRALASNPDTYSDFAHTNLLAPDLQGKLTPATLKTFQAAQATINNPNTPKGKATDLTNWRQQDLWVNKAATAFGIDPSATKGADFLAIQQGTDTAVQQAMADGKKLTDTDYQTIAMKAAGDVMKSKLQTAAAVGLIGTKGSNLLPGDVRLAQSVKDIPDSRVTYIKSLLAAKKLPTGTREIMQVNQALGANYGQ